MGHASYQLLYPAMFSTTKIDNLFYYANSSKWLNIAHINLKLLLQKLLPIKIAEQTIGLFLELIHIFAKQQIAHSFKSILEFMFCLSVLVFL